jgi:hypothetical protein
MAPFGGVERALGKVRFARLIHRPGAFLVDLRPAPRAAAIPPRLFATQGDAAGTQLGLTLRMRPVVQVG